MIGPYGLITTSAAAVPVEASVAVTVTFTFLGAGTRVDLDRLAASRGSRTAVSEHPIELVGRDRRGRHLSGEVHALIHARRGRREIELSLPARSAGR